MKTKVLILHTSVGYGIKVTAENIFDQLQSDPRFDVRIEDIQEVEAGGLVSGSERIYTTVLDRFSGLWGFLYSSRLVLALSLPLRKFIARFKSAKTLQLLREYQPAIVISTQAAPTAVIAYLKSQGLYRGKLVAVFSDYHLHPFWLFDEVDLNVCNISAQAVELKAMGVSAEKIAVTGMPLPKKFLEHPAKQDARTELGLLQSMPIVLLTSGGRARGAIKEIYLRLLRENRSFQVVVVCGHNETLRRELDLISAPDRHPVKILGYINNMEKYMSAADVMIGKTGGPTMAEAVACRLPMVLTDVRPGHEMKNLEYLAENDIVDYGRIPREVVYWVSQILDGKRRHNWEQAFELIIKPAKSETIAQAIGRFVPAREASGYPIKHYQEA